MDPYDLHESVTMEQVRDWLRHPVTKVLLLLAAAELTRQYVLTRGVRLLGIAVDSDAAGEI